MATMMRAYAIAAFSQTPIGGGKFVLNPFEVLWNAAMYFSFAHAMKIWGACVPR
jgi:hypothetical protein